MTISVNQPDVKVLVASVGGPQGAQGVPGQSAIQRVAVAALAAGTAVRTHASGQQMQAATSDLRTRPFDGVCLGDVQSGATGNFHVAGPVPANVLQLGAGVACAVGVDAAGRPVRATDPACVSAPNWVGTCDAAGNVSVAPRRAGGFRVEDFGASCDGSTDDGAAVFSAMLAAGGACGIPLSIVSSTVGPDAHVTCATPHQFTTGDTVFLYGHAANTMINGQSIITVIDPTTISLNGRTGGITGGGATGHVVKIDPTHSGEVLFPEGRINLGTTPFPIPWRVTLRGTGKDATTLLSSSATDVFQSLCVTNTTGVPYGGIRDLTIVNTNGASTGACIWQRAGAYFHCSNVRTSGGLYGLILDQSELCSFTNCAFESSEVNVWLTNTDDYSPGATGTGYTNDCRFVGCQFDGGAWGAAVDGYGPHSFSDCNFNGHSSGSARLSGCIAVTFHDCDVEDLPFHFAVTSLVNGSGVGGCTFVNLERLQFSNAVNSITCDSSVNYLRIRHCLLSARDGAGGADFAIHNSHYISNLDAKDVIFRGAIGSLQDYIAVSGHFGASGGPDTVRIMNGTAAPGAAPGGLSWAVGDLVWNTTPAPGSYMGWVCTTAGTTGTWKAFGLIGDKEPGSQSITSSADTLQGGFSVLFVGLDTPRTLTSTPSIAAGQDGQEMWLYNNSANALTLQRHDVLPGSGMMLAATTLVVPAHGGVSLRYSASLASWIQTSASVAVS